MVPETGIEPVTFALEGRCSSTELLGQMSQKSISIMEEKSKEFYTKKFLSMFKNLIVFMFV